MPENGANELQVPVAFGFVASASQGAVKPLPSFLTLCNVGPLWLLNLAQYEQFPLTQCIFFNMLLLHLLPQFTSSRRRYYFDSFAPPNHSSRPLLLLSFLT